MINIQSCNTETHLYINVIVYKLYLPHNSFLTHKHNIHYTRKTIQEYN